MSELEYLAIGYVFFVFLIVVEAGVSLVRGNGRYRVDEAIGNIGHGVLYQTFDYYTKALVMVPFAWVASNYAFVELPMDTIWGWVVAVLLFDFVSYWYHRHAHEISAMWAVHAVHHAAEDFNLGAALRQPLFSQLYVWLYRLPLALVMPLEMFVIVVVFDYLYQFLQHTQYVGKLGPIEWIMNTPSHHRVHHGRDDHYLDKNYGGIFIIWDRLFGTFQVEENAPDFGISKPIGSVDPVWGNLVFWVRLIDATRRAPDFRTRLAVWFQGPGDLDRLVPPALTTTEETRHSRPTDCRRTAQYVLAHALLALPALPALIYFGAEWGVLVQLGLALFLVVSTTALVALLERRSWARRLEWARLLAVVAGFGLVVAVPI